MPLSMVRECGLQIAPLTLHLGDQSYPDRLDEAHITNKEVYRQLRTDISAGTSAANVEQFVELLQPVLEKGKDALILAFSSALSSTCDSAFIAAKEMREAFPDREIRVVDTKCASFGMGLLVYTAAKLADAGKPLSEVADEVERLIPTLCHFFTVDSLKRLKMGGRISAASAIAGGLLNIKPIMRVDDDGRLVPVSKVRGRNSAIDALADCVAQNIVRPEEQTVFISHGDCLEEVEILRQKVSERVAVKGFEVSYVGPVIGGHTGAGVIAIFFYGAKR